MMDKNEGGNRLLMKHRGARCPSLFYMRLQHCLAQVRDDNGAEKGIKVALDANVRDAEALASCTVTSQACVCGPVPSCPCAAQNRKVPTWQGFRV